MIALRKIVQAQPALFRAAAIVVVHELESGHSNAPAPFGAILELHAPSQSSCSGRQDCLNGAYPVIVAGDDDGGQAGLPRCPVELFQG